MYRSSRDGVDAKSFHRNCDNKGATIFVAKIRGSTQLIGGLIGMEMVGKLPGIVLHLIVKMEKMFLLQNWVMLTIQIMLFIALIVMGHMLVHLAIIIGGISVQTTPILI